MPRLSAGKPQHQIRPAREATLIELCQKSVVFSRYGVFACTSMVATLPRLPCWVTTHGSQLFQNTCSKEFCLLFWVGKHRARQLFFFCACKQVNALEDIRDSVLAQDDVERRRHTRLRTQVSAGASVHSETGGTPHSTKCSKAVLDPSQCTMVAQFDTCGNCFCTVSTASN